jgi:hypothetical protein
MDAISPKGEVDLYRHFRQWTPADVACQRRFVVAVAKKGGPLKRLKNKEIGVASMSKNLLCYGDNLDILRCHIADETVDLI